jgi:hypothetical protein
MDGRTPRAFNAAITKTVELFIAHGMSLVLASFGHGVDTDLVQPDATCATLCNIVSLREFEIPSRMTSVVAYGGSKPPSTHHNVSMCDRG